MDDMFPDYIKGSYKSVRKRQFKRKAGKGYIIHFTEEGIKIASHKKMLNLTDGWENARQNEIPFLTHHVGRKV